MSQINLNLFGMSYGTLAGFAQTIHDGFVAHALDYPTPVPAPALFQGDIDDLNDAIAAWGVKGNRGSHNDHLALIAARLVIRNDLRMLAFYAQQTKPENPDSWSGLGFQIKKDPIEPKPLEVVQNFRHFIARNVPNPNIKLRWKRPLDTNKNDVKGYLIQRSSTSTYPVVPLGSAGIANIIGIVPNTSFIDTNPLVGENWYWVTPFNSVGLGVTSDGLMVFSTRPTTP